MLVKLTDIVDRLLVYPERMQANIDLSKGLTFSQAILLALTMQETVYGLVSYAWSGIGSSFGPALILLLFWKKFSRAGIFASLATGTISTVIWKNFFEQPTGISERLASFVCAFLMALLFSLLIPEKKK